MTTRIARRPLAAWLAHAVAFSGFALFLRAVGSGPVDWLGAVALGTIVATGVVGGTLAGHWIQRARGR